MKNLDRYFLAILITGSFLLFKCKNESKMPPITDDPIAKDSAVVDSSSFLILDAALYYSKDMFTEAMESYTKLLKIDSQNGEYYYRLGYCLAQLNRDSEAVKNYEKAADLGHRKFEAYRSIGVIYYLVLDDDSKAMKYFNKCIKIDPNANDIKEFIRGIRTRSGKVNL